MQRRRGRGDVPLQNWAFQSFPAFGEKEKGGAKERIGEERAGGEWERASSCRALL